MDRESEIQALWLTQAELWRIPFVRTPFPLPGNYTVYTVYQVFPTHFQQQHKGKIFLLKHLLHPVMITQAYLPTRYEEEGGMRELHTLLYCQ